MPWTAAEASGHTKKANTPEKRKKWAKIANAALRGYAGKENAEGIAIATANKAMDARFWDGRSFKVDEWSEEAREAALAARQANAKGDQKTSGTKGYIVSLSHPEKGHTNQHVQASSKKEARGLALKKAGEGHTVTHVHQTDPAGSPRLGLTKGDARLGSFTKPLNVRSVEPDEDDEDDDIDDLFDDSIVQILGDAAPQSVRLYDAVELDDAGPYRAQIMKDGGYLKAMPRIARTGIQVYRGSECGRPDLDQVRIYRPPETVFAGDTVRKYTHLPITIDHPPEPVTADNWKKYAAGETGDEVLRDGNSVRVPMILRDSAAIAAFNDGKKQLSVGYDCDLDWTPGVVEGETYDAVQKNVRPNHLAQCDIARGGPLLSIGDNKQGDGDMNTKRVMVDGIECEMTDVAAQVVQRTIQSLKDQSEDLKKKLKAKEDEDEEDDEEMEQKDSLIKTKDAEIATLKQQLKDATDPAKLDALVKDRSEVGAKAKAILGDSFKIDGKSAEQVRREVVDAKLGDVARGWNDAQITASFNTITASAANTSRSVSDAARAFSGSGRPGAGYGMEDGREKAYTDYNQGLQDAWRTPAKAN